MILNHIHKLICYQKDKHSKPINFRCFHPHCSYVKDRKWLLGKAAICWGCEQEFILEREALARVKPTCISCRASKAAELKKEIEALNIPGLSFEKPKELIPTEEVLTEEGE